MNQPYDEIIHQAAPHSIEAEQSILGALLLNNAFIDDVLTIIKTDDFYREDHRLIFAGILQLSARGQPADVITLNDYLKQQGKEEASGGLVYLNQVSVVVPSAANLPRYAQIVAEKARLRRLISLARSLEEGVYRGGTSEGLLATLEKNLLEFAQHHMGQRPELESMNVQLMQLVERIDELYSKGGADGLSGLSCGFTDLDKQTSGLQDGDLIIVAGRPSMGKTSLAMNMAEHAALHENKPVAVFSMEMSTQQLLMRVLSSTGRLDLQKIRTGKLQDTDWNKLTLGIEKLSNAPIYIDESAGLTVTEIVSRSRKLARKTGDLGLVIVDYLQLLTPATDRQDNRAQELGEMSRALKQLAKELKCPVIALSQLNRSVETRTNKRPMMADLRESGSIEQDADLILFIYRDEVYNADSMDKGTAEIIIAKQRNGPIGTVRLVFNGAHSRFDNFYVGSHQ